MWTLRESLSSVDSADFFVVDLKSEKSKEWLTSRLYLFTYLLGRLKGVRAVVFVATRGDTNKVFLGVAHADDLLRVLAENSPRFRVARLQAVAEAAGRLTPDSTNPATPTPVNPKVDPRAPDEDEWWRMQAASWTALALPERFLTRLQWTSPSPIPDPPPPGWLRLPKNPDEPDGPETWEHASWVRATDLSNGFIAPIFRPEDCLVDDRSWSSSDRVREVARARGDFVALLSPGHRFERLIDRRALLESLGKVSVDT